MTTQNCDRVVMHPPSKQLPRVIICCPDFAIGGFSSHAINLAHVLRRRGYHVGALVSEPFGELVTEFKTTFNYLVVVRRGLESRNRYLRRLVSTILSLEPDIIINNVVPFVQATFPYLPSRLVRISVVHSVAGTEADVALTHAVFSKAVVAVSDNILEKLQHQGVNSVRTVVIPVGVDVPPVNPVRIAAREPLRLIFVGRLEPAKNLFALVRIGIELRRSGLPFRLTVVGDGTEVGALREKIREAGLQGAFAMTGALGPVEISRLLHDHDFFLMTSHYEGTPHTLLEAMAHGLVALASRIPGSTDRVISSGVDGFLCDRDSPSEYSALIQRLQRNADEFAGVSNRARETIISRFGVERSADRYEALFRCGNGGRIAAEPSDCRINPALIPLTSSLPLQVKHRVADVWRWIAHGKHRVMVNEL